MTIAFVCPYSFSDYVAIEKALLENSEVDTILCATPNACKLVKQFVSKYDHISHKCENRGRKVFNLRKIVQMADKVVLFEYSDYDGEKYSLTQKALAYAREIKRELQYIEYNRSTPVKNATYMFEGDKGFHHSESRWNAIAQLAFEWMGKAENALELNVYESSYLNKTSKKWLSPKEEHLDFSGMNSKNTIVEGGLTHTVFGLNESQWNKDFSNIKPDIVHIGEERIVIVEVKTIGASVKENMDLYQRLIKCLEKYTSKSVSLYYLLSYGHRPNSDWTHLENYGSNILLWEELFLKIKDSELAPYIHPDLEQYTLMPDWLA